MTMSPLNYFGAQHETPDPLKHDKTRGPEMLVHCPHHLLSLTQKNMQRHQTSVYTKSLSGAVL